MLVGLVKTIFIIAVIYFIGKIVGRIVVPLLFQGAVKKAGERMQQQQQEASRRNRKQEGEVTINYKPKSDKSFGKDEGDYIDFEEVK